ncbi:Major phosphate-irrepressible acid phosphatase [Klebsiella variicola]|nr:Major phosphate-irrepressible acid phosphatase [Klebsiella variicola]
MKKRVLALCPPVSSPLTPLLWFPGNDVTTKPDLYYLTNAQAIDSWRCCRAAGGGQYRVFKRSGDV